MKNKVLVFTILLACVITDAKVFAQTSQPTPVTFGTYTKARQGCANSGICSVGKSGTSATWSSFWWPIQVSGCPQCGMSTFSMTFNYQDAVAKGNFPSLDSGANYVIQNINGWNFGQLPGFPASFVVPAGTNTTFVYYTSVPAGQPNAGLIFQSVYWSPQTGWTLTNPFTSQMNMDAVKKINAKKAMMEKSKE